MLQNSTLDTLPFEVLSQIASSFEHAHSLLALSQTCRQLHNFVDQEGWHAFVSSHFPRYNGPPLWRDAAHSLTSLSKSWDKRALNAKFILPQTNISVEAVRSANSVDTNSGQPGQQTHTNARPSRRERNSRRAGQTMGYHPVIDCAEHWHGESWTNRSEILAVGAGAEIIVRNRQLQRHSPVRSESLNQEIEAMSTSDAATSIDDHGHKSSWRSWRDHRFQDGKDDVSTLKIMNTDTDSGLETWTKEIIIGRASGGLERVRFGERVSIITDFATEGQEVRSMDLSSPGGGLLAAGLGNKDVALYDVDSTHHQLEPVHQFSALCQGQTARTWSTRFLSPTRLAIGHGVSETPLDIYDIGPDGASQQPIRRFPAMREKSYGQPPPGVARNPSDAVYSIAPLPESNRGTNSPSQVFASGWYSGAIRLHDLRSRESAVTTFVDPLEAGAAVYSILPMGMDRIVAGTALHAKMQVFDLRSPPIQSYAAPGVMSTGSTDNKKNGYSLFLARDFKTSRKESSVYSLASSSPFSPTIYAGLEGSIMQIDLFSSVDSHPNPIYLPTSSKKARTQRERYYASLAMMDYGAKKLSIQRYFGRKQTGEWDDRWLYLT